MAIKSLICFIAIWLNCSLALADWLPVSKIGLKPAIGFELKNLDGKTVQLSHYKSKVVLVNFWATWCEPCKEEFPELIHLQEKYGTQGLVVLAVNLAESKPRIQTFLKSNLISPNSLEILLDNSSLSYKAWRVKGIPTTYLVSKKGLVEAYWMGPVDADDPKFTKAIEKELR